MKTDSALILAGGRSTRMGYDKKQLELDGAKVMDRLITRLYPIFSEILVSSNEPFVHERVITLPDEIGAGPLAGIYRGLNYCRSEYLYVVACDMPFISVDYIQYMKNIVSLTQADACVARRGDGFYEPFNSFFNKCCIPLIHDALVQKEYKISILLDKLNLHIVEPSVFKPYNNGDMFFNINYKEDLERARLIADGC